MVNRSFKNYCNVTCFFFFPNCQFPPYVEQVGNRGSGIYYLELDTCAHEYNYHDSLQMTFIPLTCYFVIALILKTTIWFYLATSDILLSSYIVNSEVTYTSDSIVKM